MNYIVVDEGSSMHCARCGDSLMDKWGKDGLCAECVKERYKMEYDTQNPI